ncbi:MAG: hypothetical protein ACYDAM_10400 [Leptospirales bacterium]
MNGLYSENLCVSTSSSESLRQESPDSGGCDDATCVGIGVVLVFKRKQANVPPGRVASPVWAID